MATDRYVAVPMEPTNWGWCVLDTKTNHRDNVGSTEQYCIAEAKKRNAQPPNVAARLVREFHDGTAEKDWPVWAAEIVALTEKTVPGVSPLDSQTPAANTKPASEPVQDAASVEGLMEDARVDWLLSPQCKISPKRQLQEAQLIQQVWDAAIRAFAWASGREHEPAANTKPASEPCTDCTDGIVDTSGFGDFDNCDTCGGTGKKPASEPVQDAASVDTSEIERVLGYLRTDEAEIRAAKVNATWADTMARASDHLRAYAQRLKAGGVEVTGATESVDWKGLAMDLEAQAKRVESQTVERAMLAAAHGLRLMGGSDANDAKDAALTDERIEDMGHRYAWRYKQATADGPFYTFNAHCLRDFARAIERELKGGDSWSRVTERKPNGEPSNYERAAMSTHQPKESGNG